MFKWLIEFVDALFISTAPTFDEALLRAKVLEDRKKEKQYERKQVKKP